MDDERIRFLYGDDIVDEIDDWDLDSESDRLALIQDSAADLPPIQQTLRAIVANHILDDDPPEVWATVERVRADGLDAEVILNQLSLALEPTIHAAVRADQERAGHADAADGPTADRERGSMARYLDALAHLPLPATDAISDVIEQVVLDRPGISADDIAPVACDRLGRTTDDATVNAIERLLSEAIEDGIIEITAGDRLVHPGAIIAGIVLTHRLNESEIAAGVINASFDLSPFGHPDEVRIGDDAVGVVSVERGQLAWIGPDGWLAAHPADTVVAITVSQDGSATLQPLAHEPPIDRDLVARLREAYDLEVDEPGLPVSSSDLVLQLLLDDRSAFAEPVAPLTELAEAAGLEVRRDEVAHDDEIWFRARSMSRRFRVSRLLQERSASVVDAAWQALDIAELAGGADAAWIELDRPLDDELLLEVLRDLGDLDVLLPVVEALTDDLDDDTLATVNAFTAVLHGVARRGPDRATAHLLDALVAERRALPLDAEQHLRKSLRADDGSPFVTDRLAWYASDRGDAATAARMWRQLELDSALRKDLAIVEPFAAPSSASLGRNEPCWCGSGRKYKQCHLGQVEQAPLPDRVAWLCRKAAGFVDRRGPGTNEDVISVAMALAADPFERDSLLTTFDDPLVIDLVLHELGWFGRFLAERGELLPEDELLLATSWGLVDRTVYEVVAVQPGEGFELRDLGTGEVLDVRERTASRDARPHQLICARAVPDGERHQLVGAVIPVRPGREGDLLDLLDEGDALDLASWVRAASLPPTLTNREGEPFLDCAVVVRVPDADEARAFLDLAYEHVPDEDRWEEMFALDDVERIVRASLTLEGSVISISTNSDPRADRVVAALLEALPGATVSEDERTPLDERLAAMVPGAGGAGFDLAPGEWDDDPDFDPFDDGDDDDGPDELDLDDPQVRAAIEEIRDGMEARWCDQSIPTLGGRTPRECATDPTRREEVVRLIASFEGFEAGGDLGPAITMRPARLRELLGL